ncbi:GAF domain-containing protein, partial [Modestobacter versicolor]
AADRARVVARLSQELVPAESLLDVLRAVDRFLRSPLGAVVALLGVSEAGCDDLQVWALAAGAPPSNTPRAGLQLTDAHPLAAAVRERRPVPVTSRAAGEAEYAGLVRAPTGGAQTSLSVPMVLGQHSASGGLLVGWGLPREVDAPLEEVVVDLARHVGHALDRVLLRDQRLALGAPSAPLSVPA